MHRCLTPLHHRGPPASFRTGPLDAAHKGQLLIERLALVELRRDGNDAFDASPDDLAEAIEMSDVEQPAEVEEEYGQHLHRSELEFSPQQLLNESSLSARDGCGADPEGQRRGAFDTMDQVRLVVRGLSKASARCRSLVPD